ncbi:MAG: hypothetical protein A2136_01970 [Chloroflexi bacterium RBG_16_54_11]|nr:MAG: hypothetical protein A2136_01970 [Chloroflexi bacterium RBG_16_54_11]
MSQPPIARMRLFCQQLSGTRFSSPAEIVTWMGAMQAQDYPMAKWAIGARLPASTDVEIESAIDRAEIIRTHLLRPTWHFVAAEDVYWLLDLTASHVKTAQSGRERDLELTDKVFAKSNSVIEKALSAGRHLTRDELVTELNKAGIATDQNRASHLFTRAELEKIICSGATREGKLTYALLAERVPKVKGMSREESLAELARRYFTSRCPATWQDFAWWSGLPSGDARHALELLKPKFHSECVGEQTYLYPVGLSLPGRAAKSVFLLPPYDEFTLSYADRSASFPPGMESHMKEISDRGIFRPVLVVDGQVSGTWKRIVKKDSVLLEIQPYVRIDSSTLVSSLEKIRKAALRYGKFLGKRTIDVEMHALEG